MRAKDGLVLVGAALVVVLALQAFGRTKEPSQPQWLEPKNPTRLEWLALEKQALEGDTEFGEDGMTVNFYLGADSFRTGIILCDLEYLPSTRANLVQMREEGILRRFERHQQLEPWARVKVIKTVAKLN